MSTFININNREQLKELLLLIDADTKPLWGKMTPQQMVEHLIVSVEYTNGKKIGICDRSAEDALQAKQWGVYTDAEIPKNVILGTLPNEYSYASIELAIEQLMIELHNFDSYFKLSGITSVHGGFGPMNHNEWLTWHGKHFTHHLKQFGVWP
ncbi:hypothetical protein [Mucilaginibacter sp.]